MAKDVEGECNAHLYIADNHMDGSATMRCQLPKDHEGAHKEVFYRKDEDEQKHAVIVTWEKDERCWHEWVDLKSPEGKSACIGDTEWMDEEYLKRETEHYERKCERHTRICTGCSRYE